MATFAVAFLFGHTYGHTFDEIEKKKPVVASSIPCGYLQSGSA
jgi:hypothetical protein